MPTIANEITYSDGSPNKPPTAPLQLPTTACTLVGVGQEVVVPVVVGGKTVVELKSWDPNGGDLETRILTWPTEGSLHSYYENDTAGMAMPILIPNDVVLDTNRTENKRVVYTAPSHLANDVIFSYSASDGAGDLVTATVRLVPHVVETPPSITTTIPEDTLQFFSLAQPSQVTQQNMHVVITTLPERGTLFQAQ